ncbi:MAG: hypothetical protein GY765_42535 [bacterium]|nr:hypothetical protein [bacterium]
MEHSLQLLLVSIIAYGLIIEVETDKLEPWFLVAIVAAPLIRYENLAVSVAAIGYLAMRRYFKPAASVAVLLCVLVGGFSVFLVLIGLEPFPSSLFIKSNIVASGAALQSMVSNLLETFTVKQGIILFIGALLLLSYQLFAKAGKRKQLALFTIIAVSMHFVAGRYGWYNRYEIYILAFFFLMSLYFLAPLVHKKLTGESRKINLIKIMTITIGFVLVVGVDYIRDLKTLPIAANNIYEQQYQMHRFVVDFYDKPVAVNDLGYISYKNANYVLDLHGLGSTTALNARLTSENAQWMKELTAAHNVELAMIYPMYFKSIPKEWIRIGELHLGKERITVARSNVTFFAMSMQAYPGIVRKLKRFIKTLPHDVRFTFQ